MRFVASLPSDSSPERVIETLYKPSGRLSERRVSKAGTLRQSTAWEYFLNGDLKTMVTRAGDPLVLRESHAVSYQEDGDSGAYVDGNRTRDVWRRDSPRTSVPCQASDCTTSYTYDARDRLTKEVRDRGSQDRTTEFELTPSGSIDAETVDDGEGRLRFDNTYVGDQLRLRETYMPDGSGGWKRTPEPQDDFRYWYDALTGSLDCVTYIVGGDVDEDCNAREGAQVSADLVEDYAYDNDDKLRSSRKWDPVRAAGAQQPDSVAVYDYDALDRPVTEHEHHPAKGWAQPRLTRFSYLGTSDSVSQEQQYKVATLETPVADGQLDETKTYSYDPGGWRVGLTDVKKGQNGAPDETRNYVYGYDPHNNVSQLLSESGAIKASYGYTVYGEKDKQETAELKHDGTPGDVDSQSTDDLSPLNPYRYTDKRYDSGSGQLDMGARRFGPSVGQFLQEDVLKDALGEVGLATDPLTQNRYSLAAGNPVSFIESDGHMPIAESGYTAAKIQNPDAKRAEDGPTTSDGCSMHCGPVPNYAGKTSTDASSGGSQSRARYAELGRTAARQVRRATAAHEALRRDPAQVELEFRPDPNQGFLDRLLFGVRAAPGSPELNAGTLEPPGGRFLRELVERGVRKLAGNAGAAAKGAARTGRPSIAGGAQRPGELPFNARSTKSFDEISRRLAENHGIDRHLASERLHEIKQAAGRGGADDVLFDLTGGVNDPRTRELLGSLTQGGARGGRPR